jgi:hypothetical protein
MLEQKAFGSSALFDIHKKTKDKTKRKKKK